MKRSLLLFIAAPAAVLFTLGTALVAGGAPAGAVPTPTIVYAASGTPCGSPSYPTISAAVSAVASGGEVIVCNGTYSEDVVVDQPVSILGHGAVVDPGSATNSPYYSVLGNNAFTVVNPDVTIEGFTVEGASGSGILTVANSTTVVDNVATNNAQTGIDLESSDFSYVANNQVKGNALGGITLSDDAGTSTFDDQLLDNNVVGNPGGCGFIIADHTGAGIYDNEVIGNESNDNGTSPAGSGAGILLASPIPGGEVDDNIIYENSATGNGLGGITVHSHYPGQNFSGNLLVLNRIGINNTGGAAAAAPGNDEMDPLTTGIYIGSASALAITVSNNVIQGDHYGIFAAGPVTVSGLGLNLFLGVTTTEGTASSY